MGALPVFSLYALALVLNRYLGAAAAGRNRYRAPRNARDSRLEPQLDGGVDRDAVTQHMFKLYEKYNQELNRPREGNTVRSFQAVQDSSDRRSLYRLNLTSLQDSEAVKSATLHFLFERRPRQRTPWFCGRFQTRAACRAPPPLRPPPSVRLLFYPDPTAAAGPAGVVAGSREGPSLGNVTLRPHGRGAWQTKDVTAVVKEARGRGRLLLALELDYGTRYRSPLAAEPPYLLVYAHDRALAEPNSVAATLQRYDPLREGGGGEATPSHPPPRPEPRPELKVRVRRHGGVASGPILDNELPEVDYYALPREVAAGYGKEELWRSTYLALKPQATPPDGVVKKKGRSQGAGEERRGGSRLLGEEEREEEGGKPPTAGFAEKGGDRRRGGGGGKRGGGGGAAPVLSFDERTMRKARRRQRGDAQPRGCARRSLRVDFADIGWSEWVLAPDAFDAYYCAGACGFPLPKTMRPSNHATIQSIVRAVGIVPGVPEPCCVPDKMAALAVLYREERAGGLVLKLYPGMSVQSCSCR